MNITPTRTEIDNHLMAMASDLARAITSLTLPEQQLVCLALANTNQDEALALSDRRFRTVAITAKQWDKAYGGNIANAYANITNAVHKLLTRTITHALNHEDSEEYQWIIKAIYRKGSGTLYLEWHPDVVPLLFAFGKSIFQFRLRYAHQLKSAHTWNLFFILGSWSGNNHWKCSVDQFCDAMQINTFHRNSFKDLRKKIIDPAVAELNKTGAFHVSVDYIKTGVRITNLHFKFRYNRMFGEKDIARDEPPALTTPPNEAGPRAALRAAGSKRARQA